MHSTRCVLNIHFSVNCIGRLNSVHQRDLIHVTFRAHIQLGFIYEKKRKKNLSLTECKVVSQYLKNLPSQLLYHCNVYK